MSKPAPLGHLKQLDGWRGLSIIFVLIGHTCYLPDAVPAPLHMLRELGELGVTWFFILSGFLITSLLCNEETATGGISLKSFYLRRTFRIMPAYYVMVAITATLALAGLVTDVPWHTFVVCIFYLKDFAGRGGTVGHTWSLALEEQFYLVWPFCLTRIPESKRIKAALAGCILIAVWRAVAMMTGIWKPYLTFRPDFRADAILLGCLLAFVWTYKADLMRSVVQRTPGAFVVFIGILTFAIFLFRDPALQPVALTIQTWLSALLISQVIANAESPFAIALRHPLLRWFGKVSYSLYLWQQMFLMTTTPSWGILRELPFNLICVLIIGTASYYLIELPFLSLRKRLAPDVHVKLATSP